MCIVIDANCFSSITNREARDHMEFRPLVNWLLNGKGKIVYGGTEYAKELAKNGDFGRMLRELEKRRKIVKLEKTDVDAITSYLARNVCRSDFDDHHILAICLKSGCKLICSSDPGLHALVDACYAPSERGAMRQNCPRAVTISKPRIYQKSGHAHLLCDENIAACCR